MYMYASWFVIKAVNRCLHICKPNMHTLSLATVYMAHTHMFGAKVYLVVCLFVAAYMQMHVLLYITSSSYW